MLRSIGGKAYATTYFTTVATSETTSSASAADLATVGPTVTITLPTNALVGIFAEVTMNSDNGANTAKAFISDSVEGSTQILSTVATTPTALLSRYTSTSGGTKAFGSSNAFGPHYYPLTAGAHTIKLQYAVTAGTGTFSGRKLWVVVFGA